MSFSIIFVNNTAGVCLGTVKGSIGLVIQLPKELYDFLLDLQTRLNNVIKSIGRIDHNNWRSFLREKKEIETSKSKSESVLK